MTHRWQYSAQKSSFHHKFKPAIIPVPNSEKVFQFEYTSCWTGQPSPSLTYRTDKAGITLVQVISCFSTFYWCPKWKCFKDVRPTPSIRWKQLSIALTWIRLKSGRLEVASYLTSWPVSWLLWSHSVFTPLILANIHQHQSLLFKSELKLYFFFFQF